MEERGRPGDGNGSGNDLENQEELRALARLLDVGEAPGSAPEAAPGVVVSDRFELVGLLGVGRNGGVWRAHDRTNQGRELALKILRNDPALPPALLESCRDLEQRLGRLTHPTVNRLRAVGRMDGGPIWLAWDLVPGENLRSTLDNHGALPPRRALEITRQILQGLELGHGQGLVHGGLSPTNVVLANRVAWSPENPFGVGVKLLDFGFRPLLRSGGDDPSDPREDLLTAAALLAELLTGTRIAPDGSDWIGSRAAIATAALAPATQRMLDTALAPDPAARFASATEFRAAIERSPDWRATSRLPAGRVAALTLGVAGAAVLGLFWLRSPRGDGTAAALPTPSVVQASVLEEQADELRRRAKAAKTDRDRLAAENERLAQGLEERATTLRGDLASARQESEARRLRAEAADTERQLVLAENERLTRLRDDDVASLESELSAARDRLETLNAQSEDRDRRAGRAQAERDRAVAESERLRGRISALEAAAREAAAASDPSRIAAGHVDAILESVAAGDTEGARWAAQALRRDAPGMSADGVSFVVAWIDAERALTEHAGAKDAATRAALLDEADRRLDQAWRLRPAFADGVARLSFVDGDAPSRAERIEGALGGIERRIVVARAELPGLLEARAAAILASFPGPDGAAFLFHATTPDGRATWLWEAVTRHAEPSATCDASWTVTQHFFDSEGGALGERSVTVQRRGTRFVELGLREREMLDLGGGGGLKLDSWSPGALPELPRGLPATAAEIRAFGARIADRSWPSLVVVGETRKTWYSPELGLVRHAEPGRITRELVYARLPRR